MGRSRVICRAGRGVVARARYLRVDAELDIFKHAETAHRDCIATAATLGVPPPHTAGIRGHMFRLAYDARGRVVHALSRSGSAGCRLSACRFATQSAVAHCGQRAPIAPPGAVDDWRPKARRFGTRQVGAVGRHIGESSAPPSGPDRPHGANLNGRHAGDPVGRTPFPRRRRRPQRETPVGF